MYANNFDGTDPEKYLGDWRCDQSPRPDDPVAGRQYLALLLRGVRRRCIAKMGQTAGAEERGKIAVELNDMIVNSSSYIGLIDRGRVSTKSNTLGGVVMNPWDSELWNAADWYRSSDPTGPGCPAARTARFASRRRA